MSPLAHKHRLRDALLVLSRDRLSEIAARLGVEVADRRSAASHAEALAHAKGVTVGDILAGAKRSELKDICDKLGIDSSGKEKGPILARIAAGLGEKTEALTLTSPESGSPKHPKESGQRSTSSNGNGNGVADYRHPEATRKNNPPAGLIEFDRPPQQPTKKYTYDPHLDPQLQWAGKAEHTSFEVDTVSLHIHEQISVQAILKAVKREDAQRDLFAEPKLSESKQIDFYAHEVGWRNRLVLGDSLLVMNSLLEREQMATKVQCIYVDPPYGVKFNSNFQPSISKRDVKDGDDRSLTQRARADSGLSGHVDARDSQLLDVPARQATPRPRTTCREWQYLRADFGRERDARPVGYAGNFRGRQPPAHNCLQEDDGSRQSQWLRQGGAPDV